MFNVPVNLSNRHIHLTDSDIEALFGPGHTLTEKVSLLQPGQFAAEEVVTITGPTGSIDRVRVVGPTRPATQCEVLTGDLYKLGYPAEQVPVRLSGDLAGSAAFTITGPAGSLMKTKGLIIAQRHIHMSPEAATEHGVTDGQTVQLHLTTPNRRTTYDDVIIRAQSGVTLECHLDIEEGNAAGIRNGFVAEVII